jgi:hypothetical protein
MSARSAGPQAAGALIGRCVGPGAEQVSLALRAPFDAESLERLATALRLA